jgi:regulator of sigma D
MSYYDKNNIKEYLAERKSINNEIQSNLERNRKLRKRLREVEDLISEFLKTEDQVGLKYNGEVVTIKEKTKKIRRSNKKKTQDYAELLYSWGLSNIDDKLEKINNITQGETVKTDSLSFRKVKKKF